MSGWRRREGGEPDLFLLGGAKRCHPILLSLAFGGLFKFGSLEQDEKGGVWSEERGQTSSLFSLTSSSFISFVTTSLTFLIFALVSGRKTSFPAANRSTRAKTASTRGRMSLACL